MEKQINSFLSCITLKTLNLIKARSLNSRSEEKKKEEKEVPIERSSWRYWRIEASSFKIKCKGLSNWWCDCPAIIRASRRRSAPSLMSAISRPAWPSRSIANATCFGGASCAVDSVGGTAAVCGCCECDCCCCIFAWNGTVPALGVNFEIETTWSFYCNWPDCFFAFNHFCKRCGLKVGALSTSDFLFLFLSFINN